MSTISHQAQNSAPDGMNPSGVQQQNDLIVMTPYPLNPGHTLIKILRLSASQWTPEMKTNAAHIAEGANSGIVINKASTMEFNKSQANPNERPYNAKLSFKVSMINSETGKLSVEQRTLRFWLNAGNMNNTGNNNYDQCDTQFSESTNYQAKQQASQLAQSYFCQLIGSKPDDDFPKSYVNFIMKLMRLLKSAQYKQVARMEVEILQKAYDDNTKPPTRQGSLDATHSSVDSVVTVGHSSRQQTGRASPLTSQKVLDIIENSYPNPISVREICSISQTNEQQVRCFLNELAEQEKISPTGNENQLYTRTTKATSDTKIQLVKQMPKVIKAKQPVIAIITSQYFEKLAVDSMISDKETFVRYRTTYASMGSTDSSSTPAPMMTGELSSSNYVYTLGNIGDHRVVSTKLTSIGNSQKDLIAAGNATTRLLGTFPEIEYVFLVGCSGGVPNYTDFGSHVRLGDVVISHLPDPSHLNVNSDSNKPNDTNQPKGSKVNSKSGSLSDDFIYVHCKAKAQAASGGGSNDKKQTNSGSSIPVSYSIHNNLKKLASNNSNNGHLANSSSSSSSSSLSPTSQIKDARWFEQQQPSGGDNNESQIQQQQQHQNQNRQQECKDQDHLNQSLASKPLDYDDCHFRLWRPAKLDLQELSIFLWTQGLEQQKHRIWEYYIDQGMKLLAQQDVDASRPKDDKDKLYMSIGLNDTIEVSHPEAADDELDLRKNGQPMCHFGPIGSGLPVASNEPLRQRMISEFDLRAFDLEFDPVVESIYGNCKESYIMIRGISDYQDGRKRKEWQQYAALVAASFMKSIIVNLKPF